MAGVTQKQALAARSYVEGMSKVAACRTAGYAFPETDYRRVFRNPLVVAEVEKYRREIRSETSIKLQDVLDGLMDAVQSAQNSAELVMAWREIGKIIGAYEHAKEIKIDIQQKIENITNVKQLERMSDTDLAKLADVEDFVLEGVFEEVEEVEEDPDGVDGA